MLQEVASLNRISIDYIQAGRYHDAIAGFQKAMHLVEKSCVADFEIDVEAAYMKATSSGGHTITEVAAAAFTLPFLPPDTNDDLFEIYNRPFLIDESFIIPPSVLHLTLCFNIGLVYHLLGLQNTKIEYMKMAIRHYQCGLYLIKRNAVENFSSTGQYWLTLALLTNAGNILWSLWCTKEALECRDRVHALLGTKNVFVLPKEDLVFFLQVCSNGIFCNRNAAPVA